MLIVLLFALYIGGILTFLVAYPLYGLWVALVCVPVGASLALVAAAVGATQLYRWQDRRERHKNLTFS